MLKFEIYKPDGNPEVIHVISEMNALPEKKMMNDRVKISCVTHPDTDTIAFLHPLIHTHYIIKDCCCDSFLSETDTYLKSLGLDRKEKF